MRDWKKNIMKCLNRLNSTDKIYKYNNAGREGKEWKQTNNKQNPEETTEQVKM